MRRRQNVLREACRTRWRTFQRGRKRLLEPPRWLAQLSGRLNDASKIFTVSTAAAAAKAAELYAKVKTFGVQDLVFRV